MKTRLKHHLEAFVIGLLYYGFKQLPLKITRTVFGWLAATLGPRLKVSKVGIDNLTQAFPEKSSTEIQQILKDCWQNLGYVAGEFPHIGDILHDPSRFEIVGDEIFNHVKSQKKAAILCAAHMGNWEISHAAFVHQHIPINLIARHHKNAFIERLLYKDRTHDNIKMISRTKSGSRALLQAIQNGELIGALVDQYASDGAFLPFFNRPAKTTLGLARLAAKYDLLFIPVQIVRLNQETRFRIIFYPPLTAPADAPVSAQAEDIMTQYNQHLEAWIRENPAQWLWLHKRWKVKPNPKKST